jgi:hypothetical protein
LLAEELLELGNAGAFDGLAGNRALECIIDLVGGVEGQLVVEAAVGQVDVREDTLLVVLDDALVLDVVAVVAGVVEDRGDARFAVGKDVDVDVRARPGVAGQGRTDQAGAELREQPHDAERGYAHRAQILRARITLV